MRARGLPFAGALLAAVLACLTGCSPMASFHPTGPTIAVSAHGVCPTGLGRAGDIADRSHGSRTLLPQGRKPDAALICSYGSPVLGTAPRSDPGSLVEHLRIPEDGARRLASAINGIRLSADPSGSDECPAATGAVTIIALSYPDDPRVDLWWAASGCERLDNGRIAAVQGGNSSFGDFQAAVAAAIGASR